MEPEPKGVNVSTGTAPANQSAASAKILAEDAKHRSMLWEPDVVFVSGEGVRLYDAEGNE